MINNEITGDSPGFREKTRTSKAKTEINIPNMAEVGSVRGMVAGMMIKSMLAKSKGGVIVCSDMIEDKGISIKKEQIW